MTMEKKPLDERLKDLEEELEAVGLATLVKEIGPGIPQYKDHISVDIKRKLNELGYSNYSDFISLAYKIDPNIGSKKIFEKDLAARVIANKIVNDLIEKGYLICVKIGDLENYIRYTRGSLELLRKLNKYLGAFTESFDKNSLACVSNVTEEDFVKQYGVKPEEYLEKVKRKLDKGVSEGDKAYKFIESLKI